VVRKANFQLSGFTAVDKERKGIQAHLSPEDVWTTAQEEAIAPRNGRGIYILHGGL